MGGMPSPGKVLPVSIGEADRRESRAGLSPEALMLLLTETGVQDEASRLEPQYCPAG